MTQHAELIERLRASFRWWHDRNIRNRTPLDAVDAIEALERDVTRMRGWISVAQAELDGVEVAYDNNCLSAAQGALSRAMSPAIQHEGASNAGT